MTGQILTVSSAPVTVTPGYYWYRAEGCEPFPIEVGDKNEVRTFGSARLWNDELLNEDGHKLTSILYGETVGLTQRLKEANERADEAVRRVLTLVRGCHDFGGGYSGQEYEAFQHGISAVENVLKAAIEGRDDLQLRTIEAIGRASLEGTK